MKSQYGIAPTGSKICLFLVLAVTLSACSGGSNADSPTSSQNALPATIASLEASGELPKLDRSSSIAGPDVDNNGIRDDIDAYLATKNYPAPQLAAAQQEAKAMQAMLTVDASNVSELRRIYIRNANSLHCLAKQFSGATEGFLEVSKNIEKLTVNTKERVLAYMAYGKAMDGTVSTGAQGDTCEK